MTTRLSATKFGIFLLAASCANPSRDSEVKKSAETQPETGEDEGLDLVLDNGSSWKEVSDLVPKSPNSLPFCFRLAAIVKKKNTSKNTKKRFLDLDPSFGTSLLAVDKSESFDDRGDEGRRDTQTFRAERMFYHPRCDKMECNTPAVYQLKLESFNTPLKHMVADDKMRRITPIPLGNPTNGPERLFLYVRSLDRLGKSHRYKADLAFATLEPDTQGTKQVVLKKLNIDDNGPKNSRRALISLSDNPNSETISFLLQSEACEAHPREVTVQDK